MIIELTKDQVNDVINQLVEKSYQERFLDSFDALKKNIPDQTFLIEAANGSEVIRTKDINIYYDNFGRIVIDTE